MNIVRQVYFFIFKHKVYRVYSAIGRVDKAEKNRIKQTKLRIFVEKNKHVNITNYWYYRYINKKWLN